MKNILLGITVALAINTVALPVYACTITPLGDTRLRIEALLNAFNQMETLRELIADADIYHVVTFNQSTRKTYKRTYELINTSAMCPIYTAREIR